LGSQLVARVSVAAPRTTAADARHSRGDVASVPEHPFSGL